MNASQNWTSRSSLAGWPIAISMACFILISLPVGTQATPACVASFANLVKKIRDRVFVPTPHVQACSYKDDHCYENVIPILKSLAEDGERLNNSRVLYIRSIKAWNVHVVLEHRGRIYDAELGRPDRGAHSVPGIPIETYFARFRTGVETRILEIPSERYLAEYNESTWENYQRQLFERAPRDSDVHRWTVKGFLRRVSNTTN